MKTIGIEQKRIITFSPFNDFVIEDKEQYSDLDEFNLNY
jgi:hypothetical protein